MLATRPGQLVPPTNRILIKPGPSPTRRCASHLLIIVLRFLTESLIIKSAFGKNPAAIPETARSVTLGAYAEYNY